MLNTSSMTREKSNVASLWVKSGGKFESLSTFGWGALEGTFWVAPEKEPERRWPAGGNDACDNGGFINDPLEANCTLDSDMEGLDANGVSNKRSLEAFVAR